jgi:hypothetical protein
MPNRLTGLDVSVFNIVGGAYIGELQNVTVRETNKTAEGKGIAEIDDWPVLTGGNWEMTGDLLISGTATLMNVMGTALGMVPVTAVTLTVAGRTYSGTAVITSAEHRMEREGVQTISLTLSGRGSLLLV